MSRRSSSTTVTSALAAMRGGEVLTLAFEDGEPVWRLGSG
jgi:hypothetical protein